jgi:hypothetical protein
VVQLGNERFLSTENDLRLTVIYVGVLVLLIFGGEALAGDRPISATSGTTNNPAKPSAPQYENITILSQTGHTAEGATSEVTFVINASAKWITASLEWTDDIGSNDEFGLALILDGEELANQKSTSGKVTATASMEEFTNLEGNYTITVKAINCPGMVSASPIDRDSGNDWSLSVTGSVVRK